MDEVWMFEHNSNFDGVNPGGEEDALVRLLDDLIGVENDGDSGWDGA
jgi:hypothetical protein